LIRKLKSLKTHEGFKKYSSNISWLFIEKIFRILIGLSVGIWVARYLGPEQLGILSYAQSFVGLFSAIATLGLDQIVVRELLKRENERGIILGTSFIIKLLAAIIVLIMIFYATYFTSNDDFMNMIIFIIASSTILQSFNVIDFYFQSKVLSKYVVYSHFTTMASSTVFKIYFILANKSLIYFAWIAVFDSIVFTIVLVYFFLHKNLSFKEWSFDKLMAISLLKDSWPMIISGMAISFYMKIDQVMIKELLNAKSVGLYAIAVKLSEVWLFFTVAITKSLYPAIINAKKVSEELYYARLQKLYQVLILISLSISIFIFLTADYIILTLYGDAYALASPVLSVYIWSTIFMFLNNGQWHWYITENLQYIASIRLIIGAVINVLLNIWLIQKYGIVGAAWATVISYAVASFFGNLISSKTRVNFNLQVKAMINIFNLRSYLK